MLLTVALILLALFLGILFARALLARGRKLSPASAPSEEEALVLAKKLQRMIQCPTVSYKDKHEDEPFAQKKILDHSSGEISTEDADVLMDAVREVFTTPSLHFYTFNGGNFTVFIT